MNKVGWAGKVIGGILGLLLSKFTLLGALIGVLIGHQFDKGLAAGGGADSRFGGFSSAARQKIFFESIFIAMGRLAKADGRVSEEEIQIARSIMHQWGLGPEDVRLAISLFNQGKDPNFPLDQQIHTFFRMCRGQPVLLRAFLEVLIEIPLIKGNVSAAEREFLWRVAAGLGFSRVEFAQLEAVLRAQRSFRRGGPAPVSEESALAEAYKALGVESSATDKEVKTAYRRLMNQHHPDKLASKGLPESMQEVAKEKTREIRAAYERIRDHRGGL
jgi:DnaJ like chaperone protein